MRLLLPLLAILALTGSTTAEVTIEGYFGATSEEIFAAALRSIDKGDKSSIQRLLDGKQIVVLSDGKRAKILETSPTNRLVKLQIESQPQPLWAPLEAVRAAPTEAGKFPVEASETKTDNTASTEVAATPQSKEFLEGYESGFLVGEALHNNGEAQLPDRNLYLLSRRVTLEPDAHPEYSNGFLKGYADGFQGLARGGIPQPPVPEMPFIENGKRKLVSRALGRIQGKQGEKGLVKGLCALIKANPKTDLYVVTGTWRVGDPLTENAKLIYDSKHQYLAKLVRSEIKNIPEDSCRWAVIASMAPTLLSNGIPWDDIAIRIINNRKDNKTQCPLQYTRHTEVSTFP